MKKTVLLLIVFTIALSANIAMPGFWNTGGGRNFVPFLKDDSLYLGKVQMQKEFITVLLYPGYAVVKGEYIMKNLTTKDIKLRVGFPVNGRFDAAGVDNVMFNELVNLTVTSGGKELPVYDLFSYMQKHNMDYSRDKVIDTTYESVYTREENWYVWESFFPAGETTVIEVYYLLPTNEASLLKGYDRSNENGFSYVLETGSTWGGVIDTGCVRVYLMDGVKFSSLIGVYPSRMSFNDEENSLNLMLTGYKPRSSDNIVIRYGKRIRDFDFSTVTSRVKDLFSLADTFGEKTRQPIKEKAPQVPVPVPDDFKPESAFTQILWYGAAIVAAVGVLIYLLKR